MLGRMFLIIFFILLLWAIAMYFIWNDRIKNLSTSNPDVVALSFDDSPDSSSPPDIATYTIKPDTVALTFDDGPTPPYTLEIIKILKDNDVKATFFVLGKNAEQYPELVRQAYQEGNAIACHGLNHLDLTKATMEQVKTEVLGCKKIIKQIIGKSPICYRPAYNKITPAVQKYIESQGMAIIKVEIDSTDWQYLDGNTIINNTLSLIEPQSEITMHDGTSESEDRSSTVKALPALIQKIKTMGLGISRICYP
ncbi:polysaccharide deacetylase family protein [Legionella brunensis]|uniref:Peptidoglycan-N-acetylglucosamine deacetylase n=1 Tax=Legionella brunensis TaxID=29422 RepID=A0A0W0SPN5_9GAMM|nr:polysaccharide deacetylase family protein [Legionella brunensis]KTC84981.1 Peptidoglycan-N-acetylglucosamine deacetylase [Legionella brunensis]